MNIVLCDEKSGGVKVKVWAEIVDGRLKISGQEFGADVESSFGSSEYEYFYDFDRENTERLLSMLPESEFMSKFGGTGGCVTLREFCGENGIKYQFFNYS